MELNLLISDLEIGQLPFIICSAGFEGEGRGHKPRNVGGFRSGEKALQPPGRYRALPIP